MKPDENFRSEAGKAVIWILILLAVVALGFYFLTYHPDLVNKYAPGLLATPTPTPGATSEPTPEPTPEATPEPTLEPTPEPTPESTPVAEVTPETELPLDFARIAATPDLWPKQVALVKQVPFPILLNGKVVGQALAPVGTVLSIVRVLPDPAKEQVEVLYQNNRAVVSATAIDLIPRASAIRNAGNSQPAVQPMPAQTFPSPAAATLTDGPKPGATNPLRTRAEFESRITVSAMRGKSTKIEGGDFDDKRDRITFTIRFRNTDPNRPSPGLRAEFYLFGQSLVTQKAVKLIQKFNKSLDLVPLQDVEFVTPEAVTQWDNTGVIFGAKYKGWYLIVRNPAGDVVLEKMSAPFLESTSGLPKATVGRYYNKKLEPMTVE